MKKIAIAVTICLLAVMIGTVTFAGAVKRDLATIDLNYPNGEGRAILNYAKGADKTEIQVNCSGLNPGQEYTVWVDVAPTRAADDDYMQIGEFVAGPNGKGNFHGRVAGDVSDAVQVAVNEGEPLTILHWGAP